MNPQQIKLKFSSGISDLAGYNRSFDIGRLRIAYHGPNRNGSSISKKAFEDAVPSMYNCPVVCNYLREVDEIGSHDVEFIKTENGIKMVNVTTPVGVVPESAAWQWEVHEDDKGVEHEYLCTDVYIWKRQEAYPKIKENGFTDESMEISVKHGYTDEKGVYIIESFDFLAFCLLGTAEPCYESAGLELFSLQGFRNAYEEMLSDFKKDFSLSANHSMVEINVQTNKEGGKEQLDKNELLTKFGLTADKLDFDIEPLTVDELEAKLHELYSLTAEQTRDELISALCVETINREWGEMCRYWYQDYDAEKHEVYCMDCEDYRLYGFTYSVNGDAVSVDFDSKKRKKITYTDFDEGSADFTFEKVLETVASVSAESNKNKMEVEFDTERNALEEKFNNERVDLENKLNTATQEKEQVNAELDELRRFKEDRLKAERTANENEIFEQFEDLTGNDAFEALRCDCGSLTLDEIEEKCYAIRGRNTQQNFAHNTPRAPRVPINPDGVVTDEPYGGLMLKYPPKK